MDSALFGDRYEIRELLGSGGMARVHLAYDTRLGRTVALKTLLPELARDADARRRFAREARAAAGLNHPGIVTVHDQDEVRTGEDIVPYLVMEYVDGSTLADLARSQVRLDIERAVRITCDILDALAHAHSRGLVHRDVKPSNVLITSSGSVKVADFGIARVVHSLTRITGTGSALGTPGYMSPEQIEDREVDARSDLYAVGCMLTELLTGTVPFPGPTPLTVMYAHVHTTPQPPSARNAAVPPELDAVVISALSKNPALRPRSAAAMRDDLAGWLAGPGGAATPAPVPAQRPVVPLHPAYNPPHTPPHTPAPTPTPLTPPAAARPDQRFPSQQWGMAPPGPSRSPGPRGPRLPSKGGRRALIAVSAAVVLTIGAVLAVRLGSSARPAEHTVTALDLIGKRTTGTGYNGAVEGTVNPSTGKGGTLKLMSYYAPDSLDPARSYSPLAWNLDRLMLRKLMDFAPQPGQAGVALAPDLATAAGTIGDGGRTYTYTLKKGVTFEDGTPITSKDIKYGIERTFATDLYRGGPTHLKDLLDQGQSYPGPYKDTDLGQLGLKSVLTPDDSTIVFHLDAPFADFPYVLALPMSSPVPQAKDTKDSYEKQPVASGPYKIGSYEPGKKLHLVRNDKWDPATDGIRTALPDVIDFTVSASREVVDNALLSGDADLDPAQAGVEDATRSKILASDSLKANADFALVGAVRYFSLQTAVAPLNDYRCRWAVQYAANRTALHDAGGGKDAGDVAGGMLPPTVGGYDPHLNTFGTATGQSYPDLAKRQLSDCGHASGFATTIVTANGNPRTKAIAENLRTQLAAVGITAKTEYPEPADLYDTLADQKKIKDRGWGIVLTTWQADWPTPAGFLRPLLLTGNPSNYAALSDQQLKDLMDEADAKTDRNAADSVWRTVDSTSQDRGTLIPFLYVRQLNYRSPRLTNVYLHPALGGVDIQALGIKN
ncbi:ABC transporter substrate-binding protein [Streptomyces sp. H10-C2]|uniref:ABC transporter substrate-binding protein n=1 Tax=unclassified Streptomyces TaxID=2593676 RepID=UPI0024B965C8|nr:MULTISPECIES: ABC transporter substrate-binding protein [unclassified Streptomyces]MDJ0345499.1 ABC transporter substrate-binding protein [Streptomyces sp. PH10-H1]MDJ0371865.1 ABC transporter substrate-binding protein [Streptomyces sp. H10-C2]